MFEVFYRRWRDWLSEDNGGLVAPSSPSHLMSSAKSASDLKETPGSVVPIANAPAVAVVPAAAATTAAAFALATAAVCATLLGRARDEVSASTCAAHAGGAPAAVSVAVFAARAGRAPREPWLENMGVA